MRWQAVIVATVVALPLVVTAVGPGPSVSAVPASVPGISNLTVGAGPFRVDGLLGTAISTVRVHVVAPDGVGPACFGSGPSRVQVILTRTSGPASTNPEALRAFVFLGRVSGTDLEGDWAGQWRIGATRDARR